MAEQDHTVSAQFNTDIVKNLNSPATHIEIFHKGEDMSFGKQDLPISMGRDEESCQIIVNSDVVSRVHCLIEVRDNQIGLCDQSTNGTFIQIGRGESFVLKKAFYPLNGQGNIKLGEPFGGDERDNVYFRMVTKSPA